MITERRYRDLDNPAVTDPPQSVGDVGNERKVDIKEPGAQWCGSSLSLKLDEPINRGADHLGARIVERGDQLRSPNASACTARNRCVASTRRLTAILRAVLRRCPAAVDSLPTFPFRLLRSHRDAARVHGVEAISARGRGRRRASSPLIRIRPAAHNFCLRTTHGGDDTPPGLGNRQLDGLDGAAGGGPARPVQFAAVPTDTGSDRETQPEEVSGE